MGYLIALVLGVLLGIAIRRRPPSASATTGAVEGPAQALEDLRREDPEAARQVEAPSTVPVSDVPSEVTPAQAAEIGRTPTSEDALHRSLQFVKNPDAARAIAALSKWKPRRKTKDVDLTESEYEESFERFLNRCGLFNAEGDVEWKPNATWGKDLGDGAGRRAYPDLRLRSTLVELKADLVRSDQSDRALGQMLRYLYAWKPRPDAGGAILCVCGEVDGRIKYLVRLYVELWRTRLGHPVTVIFKRADDDENSDPLGSGSTAEPP